jgi:hypothetical protein
MRPTSAFQMVRGRIKSRSSANSTVLSVTRGLGERSGDQAPDVDLPDPLRPGLAEQGMLHNERQRVLHRGLMCPFDHSRRCRATAHNVDTDFTGENAKSSPATVWSVAASPSQSAPPALSIHRLPTMLGQEKLMGHLSPHPRPVSRRRRSVGRPSDAGVERRNALGPHRPGTGSNRCRQS